MNLQKMESMFIWITGHSATGKTSLVNGLRDILRCDVVNIGQIVRTNFSPTKKVSDSEIFRIINHKIDTRQTNLILFDNFPFTNNQFNVWNHHYKPPIHVFYLEKEDNGRERKLKRKRFDDNEVDFLIRKLQFDDEILPIIKHMEKQNLVSRLDASRPLTEVIEHAYKLIRETFLKSHINFCDTSTITVEKRSEIARIPKKKSPFSASYDIFLSKPAIIPAHKTTVHSIEISVDIPARSVGLISGKTSVALRGCLIHQGVIDPVNSSDLVIIITNLTSDPIFIDDTNAVAQIIILPIYCPDIIQNASSNAGQSSQDGILHV